MKNEKKSTTSKCADTNINLFVSIGKYAESQG